jgi:uncharacterized protein YegL
MRCRKNVKDLTAAEKAKFIEAVLALKNATPSQIPAATTAGATSRWDDYVWLHRQVMHGAHRGAAFLPWHREFLRIVEQDMRNAVSDPNLTIPYWDWTTARSSADPGWPFTDDFMGGLGEAGTRIVRTGPFRTNADGSSAWMLHIVDAEPAPELRRRAVAESTGGIALPTATLVLTGLAVTPYDSAPVNEHGTPPTPAQMSVSYRKTNEYRFHNAPHPWVGGGAPSFTTGGSMSFMASPNDPIFFLHHCNIDRLWAVWQQKHGPPANAYLPTSGGDSGHNLPDVMAVFSPPTWPVTATVSSVIDHHSIGDWYDTDKPIIVNAAAGSVNFGDVPAGLTTYRPVQFDVQTCRTVYFEITGLGGSPNFSAPPEQGIVTVQPPPHSEPSVKANVYVRFVAPSPAEGSATGTVAIRAYIIDEQGYYAASPGDEFTIGTYNVTLVANSVARPQSAITLVIDRSGSMYDQAAGVGTTKEDLLRQAIETIADIMDNSDGIGVVSFDDLIERIGDVVSIATVTPATLANDPRFEPRGLTAIGKGIIEGADVLLDEKNKPGTPYTRHAMIVMTDGNENVPPYISSSAVNTAIETFADNIYALGFGTENNVSASALSSIADYMLITGDITTAEQRFRLVKYFTQIIAGITRHNIVVDPQGDLVFGAKHVIPFQLSKADQSASIVVVSPAAWLIDLHLQAPDGTIIGPGTTLNAVLERNALDTFYRVQLPTLPANPIGSHGGTWHAILELNRDHKPPKDRDQRALPTLVGPSIPYTLVVQSFSNLLFEVRVEKPVSQLGDTVHLLASLQQYDIPMTTLASVFAEITSTSFDHSTNTVTLQAQRSDGGGLYVATFQATTPGLYTVRFRATGSTIEGEPFQLEQTRTAVIRRNGGGVLPDQSGNDQSARCLCELLHGLLGRTTVLKWLESHGVKSEEIMETVKSFCECATAHEPKSRITRTAAVPTALTRADTQQLTAAFAVAQISEISDVSDVSPVKILRAPFPTEVHRGMTFHVPEDQIEKPGKRREDSEVTGRSHKKR